MGSVFGITHVAVADFQHVRVIPVSGPRIGGKFVLSKADFRHRVPGITNISRCPPEISAYVRSPFPNLLPAVLAQAIDDGTSTSLQRLSHFLIDGLHFLVCIKIASAAPVILQIVDSPGGLTARVLLLVPITAFITGPGV